MNDQNFLNQWYDWSGIQPKNVLFTIDNFISSLDLSNARLKKIPSQIQDLKHLRKLTLRVDASSGIVDLNILASL